MLGVGAAFDCESANDALASPEFLMRLWIRSTLGLCIAVLLCALMAASSAMAQIAGTNVNMVSGTQWPGGDPFPAAAE